MIQPKRIRMAWKSAGYRAARGRRVEQCDVSAQLVVAQCILRYIARRYPQPAELKQTSGCGEVEANCNYNANLIAEASRQSLLTHF
jgi:hypothetical protein